MEKYEDTKLKREMFAKGWNKILNLTKKTYFQFFIKVFNIYTNMSHF